MQPLRPSDSVSRPSSCEPPVGIFCDSVVECHDVDSCYSDVAQLKVVDMGYSDVDLQIDDTVFKTHRHQLAKFGYLAERIRSASSRYGGTDQKPIKLDGDKGDVEDMVNTFKILYAFVFSGPFKFEPQVLISGFRVAKTYGCPDLGTYCIERLEECEDDLTPMQRIEFARAFDGSSREVATYDAMCKRDKPFTEAEMRILGMLAWSMIARARTLEKERQMPDMVCIREPRILVVPTEMPCEGSDEEMESEKVQEVDCLTVSDKREELERLELEERERGYAEALERHQKGELGKVEELPGKQENEWEGKEHGWEEIHEHEWKGQEREWKGQGQGWKVGETSNPLIKGKNKATLRAFSALSSRYLAVAGRICGNPNSVTDSPKPGKGYVSYTKDDSTLYEYVDHSKHDDESDFDEKKPLI